MSDVIRLERPEPGIGVVVMEDRNSRNTFSREFVEGIRRVFAEISKDSSLRAVVIHGYDSYFCCGGTKNELLTLTKGNVKFTDGMFFDLLLTCHLPVISAIQGHAIGGGLAFGAFGDILVMAEESIYSANFMRYGFTPGMGATYILARKFGELIAAEMLYSANGYHGGELRERGVNARIMPREKVIPTALALARELADKPRVALIELKKQLAGPIREVLPSVVERELAMHEVTFTQPEVRERIETFFGN
ncbi:polyketide synthase [Mycobacterium sp.]|uniref:polyketide synthase n=1 Tax=Mycobacterium sp. TaxID=1785 RepID=UPI003BAACC05